MRNFEERKAEVFHRSEERIHTRRKRRNCILAFCIPLCLILTVWAAGLFPTPPENNQVEDMDGNLSATVGQSSSEGIDDLICGDGGNSVEGIYPNERPVATVDNFSFSLVWGCYGISSYDSETGELIKTTDATTPDDYVTTYHLTTQQKQQIFNLIKDLNVTTYPDIYDPHGGGLASSPSMTLVLSVKIGSAEKNITAADIALTYESKDSKGQNFLTVCKAIEDILTATDEWNALPEYEHFYD